MLWVSIEGMHTDVSNHSDCGSMCGLVNDRCGEDSENSHYVMKSIFS